MKLKYNFAIQNICGFWAAVPVGRDVMKYSNTMSLNETAKDMMELLKEEITEDELVAKMLEQYDATEEQMRADVKAFIEKLREAEALSE